jgi:ribulose-5-phosphate 4-epimerase/fuculose-1-phosphate aldolase
VKNKKFITELMPKNITGHNNSRRSAKQDAAPGHTAKNIAERHSTLQTAGSSIYSEYSDIISELKLVCNIAFDKGLIDTHSGNISAGIEAGGHRHSCGVGRFLITKTGRSLLNLKPDDFTIASFKNTDNEASSEIDIHRFILRSFPDSTVFHSHPLNAIALSLHSKQGLVSQVNVKNTLNNKQNKGQNTAIEPPCHSEISKIDELYEKYPEIDEITPLDFESVYFFPKIYVFPLNFIADIKAKNLNMDFEAKDIFGENGVFMIKSHGAFTWGKTPLDALRWALMLETSAKIILSCKI